MNRQPISSGSPYEPVMGFSRAVRVGQHVFVAGTAPVMPEGEQLPSDAYSQTKRCLEIIVAALRVVTQLIDPRWHVEIEAEALVT